MNHCIIRIRNQFILTYNMYINLLGEGKVCVDFQFYLQQPTSKHGSVHSQYSFKLYSMSDFGIQHHCMLSSTVNVVCTSCCVIVLHFMPYSINNWNWNCILIFVSYLCRDGRSLFEYLETNHGVCLSCCIHVMSGSRKYSYPSHRRFFWFAPPTPLEIPI